MNSDDMIPNINLSDLSAEDLERARRWAFEFHAAGFLPDEVYEEMEGDHIELRDNLVEIFQTGHECEPINITMQRMVDYFVHGITD